MAQGCDEKVRTMKVNEKCLAAFASTGRPAEKEGYLLKRGEVNKAFHKRWCVLKGNILFYFEKITDKEPVGFLILDECVIELAENTDSYVFLIKYPNDSRTYTFGADTQEDMEAWMRSLSSCGYEYMKLLVSELQRQLDESNMSNNGANDESGVEYGAEGGLTVDINPLYQDLSERFNPFNNATPSPEGNTTWHDSTEQDTIDSTHLAPTSHKCLPNGDVKHTKQVKQPPRFTTSQFAEMHKYYGSMILELTGSITQSWDTPKSPLNQTLSAVLIPKVVKMSTLSTVSLPTDLL